MRHFVRSFRDLCENKGATGHHVNQIVSSMHKYLASVYHSIASHHSWGGDDTNETKMMLETFVYSKCHDVIINSLRSCEEFTLDKDESEFGERLVFLQFVDPSHLEIPFFFKRDASFEKGEFWKDILSKPIKLLQSMDNMYSPAQMMRCVLEVYRGVNHALKHVIANGDSATERMPSADDCLPTIILCIICSKPKILTNLKFLELFATKDQMRGEPGYAFTNLFSAVQFIMGLNLDIGTKEDISSDLNTPSLHIAPDELKQKLSDFKKNLNGTKELTESSSENITNFHQSEVKERAESSYLFAPVTIPVHVVTNARLRGDDPFDWISSWMVSKSDKFDHSFCTEAGQRPEQVGGRTARLPHTLSLPDGFTRSYTFLPTQPSDFRISDIPILLKDYKTLVRTTEMLLVERKKLLVENNEIQMKKKKEMLDQSLVEATASNVLTRDSI